MDSELWKIWKETAFIKLCSFFIDLLAFEPGKLCPGVGIFVSFFRQGSEFCTEKAVPGAGILTEKISGSGSARRGMVTGQIDTCITFHRKSFFQFHVTFFEINKRNCL